MQLCDTGIQITIADIVVFMGVVMAARYPRSTRGHGESAHTHSNKCPGDILGTYWENILGKYKSPGKYWYTRSFTISA